MADTLYLSLWFPSFEAEAVLPRTLAVLRQLPFSTQHPGIVELAVQALAWGEPVLFQQEFTEETAPEYAVQIASEFASDDNAFVFDAFWDLWSPGSGYDQWALTPHAVRVIAHGDAFEDGISQERGHIELDFGLDSPFLGEEDGSGAELTEIGESRIKENIQKLVALTALIEKECGVRARLLWSESEENLAQKLISRLQRVQ
jgi:hypothetical protein